MLAVIALQGTGVLHAIHLGLEHAPSSEHGCASGSCVRDHGRCKPTALDSETALHLRDGQGSGIRHGREHDPGACSICQSLALLKAATDAQDAGPFFSLRPALPPTPTDSFAPGQVELTTLGPRAPPVC